MCLRPAADRCARARKVCPHCAAAACAPRRRPLPRWHAAGALPQIDPWTYEITVPLDAAGIHHLKKKNKKQKGGERSAEPPTPFRFFSSPPRCKRLPPSSPLTLSAPF